MAYPELLCEPVHETDIAEVVNDMTKDIYTGEKHARPDSERDYC
jgi:hypothetical protein